jgi:hypothetical protein
MVDDSRFSIFDVSLGTRPGTGQAHSDNRESTIVDRKSIRSALLLESLIC